MTDYHATMFVRSAAIMAELSAMQAANIQRLADDSDIKYLEPDFMAKAKELREISERMRDALPRPGD